MSTSSSVSHAAASGILDGKVPVFVFPVQLDFYYEDQTTHKRVVTIYNPSEFDVTFKVRPGLFNSSVVRTALRCSVTTPRSTPWWSRRGRYSARSV